MADIEYLKSLQAVRERAHLVLKAAEQGALSHFHYDPARMPAVVEFVAGVISVWPAPTLNWPLLVANRSGTARFRPR
jgi:hypothetical protein